MSGELFVAKLRELRYPKVDQLEGSGLDWVFENDATRPFLEWLCHDVKASNVVKSKELKDFAQIDDVLSGEELESALQHMRMYDDLDPSKMPEQIDRLGRDLVISTERREALVQQRNQLSIHHNVLLNKLSKMELVEKLVKSELKTATEQNESDGALMNESLDALMSSVASLHAIYEENNLKKDEEDDEGASVFLSQVDLGHHHKLEEKFTQEVTEFTKKQFFQGISDIASGHEDSEFKFLEIDDPDSLLRVARQEVNLEDCKELARLQAFYPTSESERVNALVEERSTQAACDFFEAKLRSLRDHPLNASVGELTHQLQESKNNVHQCQQELSHLSQVQLPALLKDSANLQVSKILRGDYDLKITRQDYFISKQDEVVAQLLKQRARYELLTMAYEIELKSHRETHHLLAAISSLLQKEHKDHEQSVSLMREPTLSPCAFQRSTVDSRDHFLLRINSLLDHGKGGNESDSSHKQLFVTHSQLEEGARNLVEKRDSGREEIATDQRAAQHQVTTLEDNFTSLEKVLYAGSSTREPQLSSSALLDVQHEMDGMLAKLEKAVMDIIKDVDAKKKVLKQDPFLCTERELFVCFMNDPDRLRRTLSDVEARLKAQLVT